jgi:hypothetical protein
LVDCLACGYGYWKSDVSNGGCTQCVIYTNTTSKTATALSSCLTYPGYFIDVNSLLGSICPAGTFSAGGDRVGSCPSCNPGRYGNTQGLTSALCSGPCPANYWCPIRDGDPLACVTNSYSAESSDAANDCFCNANYYGINHHIITQLHSFYLTC